MKYHEITLGPNGARLTGFCYEESVTLPESSAKPAVLIFPGGAYMHCVDKEGDPVAMAYLHAGFNAFVLRYCVTGGYTPGCPQKPESEVFSCALQDAEAALAHLREHAGVYHIDPNRIATVGFSAGAHLSACLNLLTDTRADAMILGYGAFDGHLRSRGIQDEPLFEKVTGDTPPAFLFATQPDATIPARNTLQMAMALNEHHVPCECHFYVTGDHGLALATHATGDKNRDVAQWFDMSVRFLEHIWSGKNLLWGDLADEAPNVDMRNDILVSRREARAVLEKYIPEQVGTLTSNPFFSYISLRRFAAITQMPQGTLEAIAEELEQIKK